MKTCELALLAYTMIFLMSCNPKHDKNSKNEQELIRLEKEWANAVTKRDTLFLHSIWTDNYEWTSSFGRVWTKTETLESIISGEDLVQSIETDDIKVRIIKNTGVVTGHSKFKETYKGIDVSGEERFTDTWVKKNGYWQCVAMHCSRIVVQ